MVARPARAQLLSPSRELRNPERAAGTRSRLAGWRPEILIFAVGLVLRLVLYLAVGSWDPARLEKRLFTGDARDYHKLAINLAEHGVYSNQREPPLEPNTFRVPLYSAYLSLFYRPFGPRPFIPILPQLVLGALVGVVVCRIGTLLFDRRAGIAAGTIFALDYSTILFSNRLYADTLFTLLVALVMLAMARYLTAWRWQDLAAAGVALGLASLARPVSLYFVGALVPVVWVALRWDQRSRSRTGGVAEAAAGGSAAAAASTVYPWKTALAAAVVLTATYVATLSPWMMRNLSVAGIPYVTSMQTYTAAWYLPRMSGAPLSGPTGNSVAELERSKPPIARLAGDLRSFTRGFVRYFTVLGSGEYPLILGIRYQRHDFVGLREAGLGAWVSATLRNRSSRLERGIVISIVLYLVALYLAAARGVWVALRRGLRTGALLLVATIVYFMIATGPIAREVRYRLPALPAIVLFAGLGVTAARSGAETSYISRSSPAATNRSAA
jgi:4-amino-4-deoxy-L-arabinose transferase-like glycosyltransferase